MTKIYNLFYSLNSFYPQQKEEVLFDFESFNELDDVLNELPDFEPSNKVIEEIFKVL